MPEQPMQAYQVAGGIILAAMVRSVSRYEKKLASGLTTYKWKEAVGVAIILICIIETIYIFNMAGLIGYI